MSEDNLKEYNPQAAAQGCVSSKPNFPADPWAHRSSGMRCMTCMWFVGKVGNRLETPQSQVGRCRRHAPSMGGYPVVFGSDWCGDHRLDENK